MDPDAARGDWIDTRTRLDKNKNKTEVNNERLDKEAKRILRPSSKIRSEDPRKAVRLI